MKTPNSSTSATNDEISEEFNKLINRIDKYEDDLLSKPQNKPNIMRYLASAAASVVLLLGVYFYISTTETTLKIANGETQELILPDGSSVILNGGSQFTYKRWFSNNREVTLKGEAFFDVVKNEGKTFTVQTEQFKVVVLGTSFNVKAYEGIAEQVSLKSGKVRVELENNQSTYQLSPGERLVFNNNQASVVEYDKAQTALWRDGIIEFNNATPFEVIQIIQREFNVQLNADANLNASLFTAKFKKTDVNDLIKVWTKTCDLKYNPADMRISK
ncbi:FecR family protein [Saccharicrinis aurantiacus]|uniref:FecR family protein n=1 Tax=Saccharicrinis aurantiacus TaxID=1849719 RepID=UPI00249343CE|nr:FecR domain-containing protein [Saccharicrinis aurantiacus]